MGIKEIAEVKEDLKETLEYASYDISMVADNPLKAQDQLDNLCRLIDRRAGAELEQKERLKDTLEAIRNRIEPALSYGKTLKLMADHIDAATEFIEQVPDQFNDLRQAIEKAKE